MGCKKKKFISIDKHLSTIVSYQLVSELSFRRQVGIQSCPSTESFSLQSRFSCMTNFQKETFRGKICVHKSWEESGQPLSSQTQQPFFPVFIDTHTPPNQTNNQRNNSKANLYSRTPPQLHSPWHLN